MRELAHATPPSWASGIVKLLKVTVKASPRSICLCFRMPRYDGCGTNHGASGRTVIPLEYNAYSAGGRASFFFAARGATREFGGGDLFAPAGVNHLVFGG
jgi:hypothetical protein